MGIGSLSGTTENVGEREDDDLVPGAVEAKVVASSRASRNSSRLTSAVALLHTSQEGSGHNS